MSCTDAEIINWLRLIRTPRLGPVSCIELYKLFGSTAGALVYAADLAKRRSTILSSEECAADELAKVRKYGGEVLAFSDPRYPKQLKNIHAPPPVITVMGDVSVLSSKMIAIVGSREASINNKRFAQMLTKSLGEHGWQVVSGMAIGIDSAAHRSAVEHNFKTVAVLGSGIDVIYPKSNEDLYNNIIAKGGAVVSEFSFGERVRQDNFPRRNRIISGLSRAIIVMEAGQKSGSLITAKFALEQNREVFAVPGSPFDRFSVGTNKLLKDGATLLTSVDDILNNMYLSQEEYDLCSPDYDEPAAPPSASEVVRLKTEILLRIGANGTPIDLILEEFGRISGVFLALVELEMEGAIHRDFHNHIYLLAVVAH